MRTLLISLAVLLVAATCSATDYSKDAACKGYWPMEHGTTTAETDLSSNGETLTGTTREASSTRKAGAYSRDWELDNADVLSHADGGSTDIYGANQALSICAWVKEEGLPGGMVASKWGENTVRYQYLLYITATGELDGYLSSAGSSADGLAIGATTIAAGTWYHLALVYNDTDIRLYVGGLLDSNGSNNPKAFTAGIANTNTLFTVGGYTNSSAASGNYDGLIDELAVFNRALTAGEILDICINGVQGRSLPRIVQGLRNRE